MSAAHPDAAHPDEERPGGAHADEAPGGEEYHCPPCASPGWRRTDCFPDAARADGESACPDSTHTGYCPDADPMSATRTRPSDPAGRVRAAWEHAVSGWQKTLQTHRMLYPTWPPQGRQGTALPAIPE